MTHLSFSQGTVQVGYEKVLILSQDNEQQEQIKLRLY